MRQQHRFSNSCNNWSVKRPSVSATRPPPYACALHNKAIAMHIGATNAHS